MELAWVGSVAVAVAVALTVSVDVSVSVAVAVAVVVAGSFIGFGATIHIYLLNVKTLVFLAKQIY